MQLDLQQFRETYIQECTELLMDMEEKLLELEKGNEDIELLHAIFRCIHSVKGGAGAFGLTQIAEFTHEFEYLLDAMRSHQIPLTPQLIELLFHGHTVVERMVMAAKQGQEDRGEDVAPLLDAIRAIIRPGEKALVGMPLTASPRVTGRQRYYIVFRPAPALLQTGNDPLYIFRGLEALGEMAVQCDASGLPEFTAIDPEQCYLTWHITLDTEAGREAIAAQFEFVEDCADIAITEASDKSDSSITKNDCISPQVMHPTPFASAHPIPPAAEAGRGGGTPIPSPAATPSSHPGSIRVDIEKIDRLVNMVGELVISQGMLQMQSLSLPQDHYILIAHGIETLAQHTRELQESVMSVRMQPVKNLFSRMPRTVRDVAQKMGKKMKLEMHGEATEIDKTIIEQLSDPLMHMIRNAADHGIEMPDIRRAAGKREEGTIVLSALNHGGRIEIVIEDDGAGINREKVQKLAIEKGVISAQDNLTTQQVDELIFAPGFSTADTISDISGRGVGMDVVRRNIEAIGGTITTQNMPGKGARFAISLPLTLAILDGMAVRSGDETYIIPIVNIVETLRPKKAQVNALGTGVDVVSIRGEYLPLVYLGDVFSITGTMRNAWEALIVVVETGKEKYGIVVDDLLGQQQVVIKSIEENSDPVEGISGATILGDGKVSMILDVLAIFRMGRHTANTHSFTPPLLATA